MSARSYYRVSVGGREINAALDPVLIDITIRDASGESADTLTIDLDDSDGQIEMPSDGVRIEAEIGRRGAGAVRFAGTVDEITSSGGRGQGRTLTITAKSADMKGKLKSNKQKHHDKGKLKQVAETWGKDAGLKQVVVDSEIGAVEREYWAMESESFMAWGARIARELGATFKIVGDRALFVARSTDKSASGQALPAVRAEWGVNLVQWSMSPKLGRPTYRKQRVRYYDSKEAKWKQEEQDVADVDGTDAVSTDRHSAAGKDHARNRAKSGAKESQRDKGGGTVTVDGDPAASAEAPLDLVGARPGIDGRYKIETAEHKYTRGGGYQTTLTLKQPGGTAGKDSRKGKGKAPATS